MDPPIINETSFSAANPSSYSLTEIWPFSSINGGGNEGLGLKMGSSFINGFVEPGNNRDEESSVTEQSGGGRKRRDANSEDESSKLVSTSSGNDLVISKFTYYFLFLFLFLAETDVSRHRPPVLELKLPLNFVRKSPNCFPSNFISR